MNCMMITAAGQVNRTEFMKKLALVTGGTAAAVIFFPSCNSADALPHEVGYT
ncbi:MAG: hypothetical protein MZV63_01515 [Marinilabiliales bacterium]|nr:hypothetical protein [Marinilabiliales bacterium]